MTENPKARRETERSVRLQPDPPARPKKLSFKERREMEGLPGHIAALEAEQRRLQAEVTSAEFYKSSKDRIQAVLARIDTVQAEIDAAMARWVELDAST